MRNEPADGPTFNAVNQISQACGEWNERLLETIHSVTPSYQVDCIGPRGIPLIVAAFASFECAKDRRAAEAAVIGAGLAKVAPRTKGELPPNSSLFLRTDLPLSKAGPSSAG